MNQSQGLTTTITQTTKLSPIQIQVIKMLELPTTELKQRIDEELMVNPLLEEVTDKGDENAAKEGENDYSDDDDMSDLYGGHDDDDSNAEGDGYTEDDGYTDHDGRDERDGDFLDNSDFNYESYTSDDELDDRRYKSNASSPDDDDQMSAPIRATQDFFEELKQQVGMRKVSDTERKLAEYVIDNLSDRGYLERSVEQLVDHLAFSTGETYPDEEMEKAVQLVQTLEPAGVGAHDVQECILLQLKRLPMSPAVKLATTLTEKYLDDVAKHHYDRLRKRFNLTEDALNDAIDIITSCNPTPSSSFSDIYETQREHIIPDFRVDNNDGELIVSLCDEDIPSLCVSRDYTDMIKDLQVKHKKKTKSDREGIRFIKKNAEDATNFIDAIRQRNETLIRTMKAIVEFQREYFLEGDDCFLQPMILEDIAARTGYDQSTISRVSNSKYVQTNFGIIPLKHLFSESLTTESGSEVSTHRVKKVLREIIDNEDKSAPYRDDVLVEMLKKEGLTVARRTVAKYRIQMGIPIAGQRKKIIKKGE